MFPLSMIQLLGKSSAEKFYIKKLCGATNAVKNSYKEKYVYSGYEIAFYGKEEWSFSNGHAGEIL